MRPSDLPVAWRWFLPVVGLVGVQAAAYVAAFHALDRADPAVGQARLLALLVLVAGAAVAFLTLRLVEGDHLSRAGVVPPVLVGAVLGLVEVLLFADELSNPGGFLDFGTLHIYKGAHLWLGGLLVFVWLPALLWAHEQGPVWLLSVFGVPVYLEAALHSVAGVGLLFQAGALAEIAARRHREAPGVGALALLVLLGLAAWAHAEGSP
jgi:hypothetical protein